MKCQSELQAYAEAGHKSAGSAKRSFLLIAHILPAVRGAQPIAQQLDTDKTVCKDDSTHALMNCLVLCVRSSDTWHEGSWALCECAEKTAGTERKITPNAALKIGMCVGIRVGVCKGIPHACI